MLSIHVRGEGSYVVVPPSFRKEGRYEWIAFEERFNGTLPPMPDLLIQHIKSLRECAYGNIRTNTNIKDLSLEGGVVKKGEVTTSDHKFFSFGRRDEDLFHTAH